MDPRIADYIRDNRRRYTKQALTDQLLEAGYSREAIDATWAILETPDRDATAGPGFWNRFWLFLVGANVVVFLAVLLLSGMLSALAGGGGILAAILAIVMAIGALIAWAIVAATHPTTLGRGTALSIGVIVPLVFALLIGGSCYALVGGLGVGGSGEPPRTGTLDLVLTEPSGVSGSGAATCSAGPGAFSVYSDDAGRIDGRVVNVSIDVATAPGPEGPAPIQPNLNIYLLSTGPDQQEISYMTAASSGVSLETDSGPYAGSVEFTDLAPVEGVDPPTSPQLGAGPISGTITWQCK